jgi:hypothetical protein
MNHIGSQGRPGRSVFVGIYDFAMDSPTLAHKTARADPFLRRFTNSPGTGGGLKGLRDRALLLLGFAGALRRSELVALDCEDISQCEMGIKIAVRQSKTDQEGQGATIGIVRGSIACPVAALQAWRDAAGITCVYRIVTSLQGMTNIIRALISRSGDLHDNSCSHSESLNCFGRFGNRPNESDH